MTWFNYWGKNLGRVTINQFWFGGAFKLDVLGAALASNLRLRSERMDKITALIQSKGWTRLEAANHCSVTQPRNKELLRGRFSLDALVNIAAHQGHRVHVELRAG